MLLVNTTYQVSESSEMAWHAWVRETYIPLVTQSGMLRNPRFYRLLIEEETGSKSYALQFEVTDFDTLDKWFQLHGQNLQHHMSDLFQEEVLGFTTLMESQKL
jgi:hypothetical protein